MVSQLVSLQAPKDVSIEEIEAELRSLWQSYGSDEEGAAATRATTFSLIVYEPDGTQQLLAALGFYTGPIDGIAGTRTEAAIKAAQQAYNLEVTGKATGELLAKLQTEFARLKAEDKLTPENQTAAISYSPDAAGAGIADAIASSNPCRIVTLCPILGEDEGVKAQVSAYCPIQKKQKNTLVCCEYITLSGTAEALERIGGMIFALAIADLPKFVWWKATPAPDYPLFKRSIDLADTIIFDSSTFNHPEADLVSVSNLIQQQVVLADINWRRLAPWQELTAAAFDPPERRSAIYEVDKVTLDYERGNQAQALMFLGWIASRLKWHPVSYQLEGGDYDIRRVKFTDEKQRTIEAELAGIPTADWGDIAGDLISLRLSSTNLDADCCTVLCSSTTGCMRMEAGGGAQACYIEQVAPVSDQKTETLLAQQLQRWGREMLYEESMAVTYQILQLDRG
jgi:glucose-6-phosphate dehydrogenase assembly protein OpcA